MKTASWLLLILANLASFIEAVEVLPGTQPLTWDGDIPLKMVDDLHAFADRETAASIVRRERHWNRDFSSREVYEKSVEPNRVRLAKYLGVNLRNAEYSPFSDEPTMSLDAASAVEGSRLDPYHRTIQWPALAGVHGVAWATAPKLDKPQAVLIFIDDPSFRGSPPAQSVEHAIVPQLDRAGCEVYHLDTTDRWTDRSTVAYGLKRTNQTHREFIFRQAFEMGRHVLGYEIERILSLIDRLRIAHANIPIGVFGFGEGGRVALLAGALDVRINVVGASGVFGSQQRMWEYPIDRNIWGYLDEFGDAEVASLIAPRPLIIERATGAKYDVVQPPPGLFKAAAPGALRVPESNEVDTERQRFATLVPKVDEWKCLVVTDQMLDDGARIGALHELIRRLPVTLPAEATNAAGQERDWAALVRPDRKTRSEQIRTIRLQLELERRSITELIDHTQALVRESEYVRKAWWKDADRKSRDPDKWRASCEPYRKHLYDEVLGRFDHKQLPPNARTRKIYDEPTYTGYEVVLNVFSNEAEHVGVWAYGILLVPKNIPSGERRPVVVCQHGLEGRPQDTIEAGVPGERFYHQFAAKLAERGFITFSPQNPYIGKDHFRQLVRKLWPLKKTLWSFIVPQHEQITDWLASLEFVDPARIGFYGLSYGGKTAMRVPALVDRYCLSICSGDFNEWIRKITSIRDPFSYMGTHEYEIMEFDLGHTFNYAEMAGLIAPRPFMVERGHRDGVGIDEWVAYEYAKVQLLYADLKIPERTEIEYFDGPHTIHGVGTFDFLHRHLKWPVPK